MIEQILHPQLVQALGWTLLHSLWQGAAFALLLASLLIALRSYTAQARYTVAAGLLAAFFITVGGTFWQQWQQASPNSRSASITQINEVNDASAPATSTGLLAAQGNKTQPLASNEEAALNNTATSTPLWKSATQSFSNYYSDHLPLLVTFWLMGVLILQLRFLGQLAFVQRLKHYGTKAFPPEWSEKIEALEAKLRIQKKVVYRTTLRTSSPMVIGWLKPVVLFPQLMLNKLSDTEIYAVLAHELAHVRRNDFAVNLLQTLLTNVFFFHPGVWWMSNQVDEEREHCCDDLAIIATGEAMPYAKTLLNVSQMHHTSTAGQPQLAMAMSGSDKRKKGSGFAGARRPVGLRGRVKRLFTTNSAAGTFREGFATACILLAGLGMAFAFTSQTEIPLADHLDAFDKTREQNRLAEASVNQDTQASSLGTTQTEPQPSPAPNRPQKDEALPLFSKHTIESIAPISTISTTSENHNFSLPNPLLVSLLNAIRVGNWQEVTDLLDQGAPVNGSYAEVGTNGTWTPLLLAASRNKLEIAKLLIGRGADVNAIVSGWTPLLKAANEGSLETLNFLLESGADLNWHQGVNSPTAITMAASEGKTDCVLALLKAGADIDGFGESLPPLHAAAAEGKTEILRSLITRGADVNQTDAVGRTALMYAASEGKGDPVALLVSSLADPNLADYTGMRAVEFALEEQAEDLANFLALITDGPACSTHLKDGHTHAHTDVHVDVDAEEDGMEYPMSEADQKRFNAAMKRSAESQIRSERAEQRAEEAATGQESQLEEVERTVEAREQQRFYGEESDIFDAIEAGDNVQLKGLLKGGANANVRDKHSRTALVNAILVDNLKAVDLLLQFGADPASRSDKGWTPLHYAAQQSNVAIVARLLKVQPIIDARAAYSISDGQADNDLVAWDYEGATPLILAIENNDSESTKLLLAAGANADLRLRKVEYTRIKTAATGSAKPFQRTASIVTELNDWSPRRQAIQQNNPKILALLK